ncbi:putative branched-subunit amino acid permease [Pseudochelatococcus lubricantis]|uniref:Branched-subunit amino acid permease n=1 Tax=Pseudochelatococcus lubricantis TaxID=1538102 RepID=A0ABX0V0V1_9HYPH|nr:AzlC family ABC transporter permease [Pseudochelatococcus lubricantis]NIJ57905.1 putative branched-subunit amino acid permease [Pseudochelatococcus lubricantis]
MVTQNSSTYDVGNEKYSAAALFRKGVVACGPTVLGYWSIGFAAGAIGTLAGFSLGEICALAGLLYAGSAQFLFYSMHGTGDGMLPIVLAVLLVNMRYLLMSSAMAIYFGNARTFEKVIGGALLTDETFGVAAQYGRRHGALPFAWLLGLNLSAWINWIVANIAGALLASSLPPALTSGLGFSLVTMFIGLLMMIWFASRNRKLETLTIAVAVAATAVSVGRIDPSVAILAATVLAATVATVLLRLGRSGGRES